jgi:hypothetical protein
VFQWFQPFDRFAPFKTMQIAAVRGSNVQLFNDRRELPRFENSRNVEMKYGFCCLVESKSALLAGIMVAGRSVDLVQTHSLEELFLNSTTGMLPKLKSQFVISSFPILQLSLKHETQTAISYDGLV